MQRAVPIALLVTSAFASFPLPFSRPLGRGDTGKDVYILQTLLRNPPLGANVSVTGTFDANTLEAVAGFNHAHGVQETEFVEATAVLALRLLSADGYVDDGQPAAALGYKYKVHVPVHANRSVETTATLFDAQNNVIRTFRVRAHGRDAVGPSPWPTFNDTDPGRNEFSPDGNTPTGLIEFDLNTPEPDPKLYGPYPVNRAVKGLRGNARFLIPTVRNGILLHTGEWPNWTPAENMPNSEGCIHAHPDDIKGIAIALQKIGVVAHKNPFGTLPYPYRPQGLLSVELVHA